VTGFNTEFTELFRDETTRRLEDMDNLLLAIESGDAGDDAINTLFRHAHTIKGAAGMLGFPEVRSLAHAAEDILARVRSSGDFRPELAAPLLRATAAMRAHLTGSGEPIDDLLSDLAGSRQADDEGQDGGPGPGRLVTAPRQPVAPQAEPAASVPQPAGSPESGSPAAGPAVAGPAVAGPAVAGPAVAGPAGSATALAEYPEADAALGDDGPARGAQPALKVPAGKIDHLLDLTGEIMQYRRRLSHSLDQQADVAADVADLRASGDRMFDDLKDIAIGMRTLPLAAITARMPRVVRDLARAAGKDLEFVVTGADTELDRVILESLSPTCWATPWRTASSRRPSASRRASRGEDGSSCGRCREAAWSRSWSLTTAGASRPK
jgi:two-component system chemotaxis sensor kinase CheA